MPFKRNNPGCCCGGGTPPGGTSCSCFDDSPGSVLTVNDPCGLITGLWPTWECNLSPNTGLIFHSSHYRWEGFLDYNSPYYKVWCDANEVRLQVGSSCGFPPASGFGYSVTVLATTFVCNPLSITFAVPAQSGGRVPARTITVTQP